MQNISSLNDGYRSPSSMEKVDRPRRREGFLFRGRPEWLDSVILTALIAEADALRPAARLIARQRHHGGGQLAAGLATSPGLLSLIEAVAGPIRFAKSANYLYYENAGDGIDPHFDSESFSINTLLMLRHHGIRRSALMLFPRGPHDPQKVMLQAGELIIFEAGAIAHGRSPAGPGEQLLLLGMGYRAGEA